MYSIFVILDIIVHMIVLQNFLGTLNYVYIIARDETQKHIINPKQSKIKLIHIVRKCITLATILAKWKRVLVDIQIDQMKME